MLMMQLVPAVTELVISELLWLNYNNPEKQIYVYLNSIGSQTPDGQAVGFETEAYAILDTLGYIRPDVYTLVIGQAFGNAAMIAACGKKVCTSSEQSLLLQLSNVVSVSRVHVAHRSSLTSAGLPLLTRACAPDDCAAAHEPHLWQHLQHHDQGQRTGVQYPDVCGHSGAVHWPSQGTGTLALLECTPSSSSAWHLPHHVQAQPSFINVGTEAEHVSPLAVAQGGWPQPVFHAAAGN